jgi:YfiR/HmsC-like
VNRFGKALVCFAALTFMDVSRAPAQQAAADSEAKARFLANAPTFVEWSPNAFVAPAAPLSICVHGDFPFGTVLAELTRGESVNGRRLEVKWIRADQSLAGCQLVFVTRSMAKNYAKVLVSVKDSGALTIGEDPEFLKAGGMLNLEPTGRGLTFDVNLDAVARGHLKISSQLLSLARRILRGPEMARS